MKFHPLSIGGVFEVEIEPHRDERGFFARVWCQEEFERHVTDLIIRQSSVSYNARKGTLRGLHFQVAPHQEAKLMRCTAGSAFVVALDLRQDSPTFKQWCSVELSARKRNSIYLPKGIAGGFQTLQDETEIFYQIFENFHPEAGRGVRWNDPEFGVTWPEDERTISERDANFPDFHPSVIAPLAP